MPLYIQLTCLAALAVASYFALWGLYELKDYVDHGD